VPLFRLSLGVVRFSVEEVFWFGDVAWGDLGGRVGGVRYRWLEEGLSRRDAGKGGGAVAAVLRCRDTGWAAEGTGTEVELGDDALSSSSDDGSGGGGGENLDWASDSGVALSLSVSFRSNSSIGFSAAGGGAIGTVVEYAGGGVGGIGGIFVTE